MFSLCIFIIDIALCIEIIIVFQKFGAGACVLIVLNLMFKGIVDLKLAVFGNFNCY